MSFNPVPPRICLPPERIAPATWVVHQVQEALGAPLCVYLNSMVILGAEPVLVDTGTFANRRQWLEDTFSLVEPADVRYVFISHDDADHTGNLAEVMELCPNATLLASWALVERHSNVFDFPLARCRWVGDGDFLDLSDRRLSFVRPPVFDSPTTRGLFDSATGTYWAVDAFAAPCTQAIEANVEELDLGFWREGMAMFGHHAVAAWLGLVDGERYAASVRRVRDLGMTTIAGAHTPVIGAGSVDAALRLVGELPAIAPPPVPDQHVLEALLAEPVPVG